jgi:hypothetical protein
LEYLNGAYMSETAGHKTESLLHRGTIWVQISENTRVLSMVSISFIQTYRFRKRIQQTLILRAQKKNNHTLSFEVFGYLQE